MSDDEEVNNEGQDEKQTRDSGIKPRNDAMKFINDPSEFVKYVPTCRVCTAEENIRVFINSLLAQGSTYASVERAISAYNDTLSPKRKIKYDSIRNHMKNHLAYDQFARREILERRAKQAHKDIVEGYETIVTPAALMEVVMNKGFENAVDSETSISFRDGMSAAISLHNFEQKLNKAEDASVYLAQVNAFTEAIKEVVPPEMYKQIIAKTKEKYENPDVVDEEIVDIDPDIEDAEVEDDDVQEPDLEPEYQDPDEELEDYRALEREIDG